MEDGTPSESSMPGRLELIAVLRALLCAALAVSAPLHAAPWLALGPDGGDARRLAPDPHDPAHLFIGARNRWIYASHPRGESWQRLAQIGQRDDLVLDSIVVDPANPRHLIVGAWVLSHDDGGIFVSNDAGLHWTNQADMRGQSVRALAISSVDPRTVVAGSLQGVFRSKDGGARWTQISPPESKEIHEIASVAIDPKDPNIIYTGTWHLPWKTTDGGEHWDSIKQGIIDDSDVFSIIVDPDSSKTVYASACSGIYKSEDAGILFHKVQGIPSTARRTRVLLEDPQNPNIVFAGTTEGLYRTVDAGKNWKRTTGPEITVNSVAIDPATHRVLLATDKGGVVASDDGGDTFHSANAGFSARQITALKRDDLHPGTIFVGVVNDKDWGGVFQSDNGGFNWTQRSSGLEGRDVFSLGQAPDGTLIAGTAHGLYRLNAADQTWTRVEDAPNGPPPSAAAHPIAVAPRGLILPARPLPVAAPNRYALRTGTVTRSSTAVAHTGASQHKAGAKKSPAKVSATSGKVSALHRTKSVAKTPAVATKPSTRLAASPRPAAAPVAAVTASLPAMAPTASSSAHGFDGGVYAITTASRTVLAATSAGLLSSIDGGVTWNSAGPADSANWRLLGSAGQNVVAGTMRTVQFSADSGKTWSPIQPPAKLTQIDAVAVDPSGTVWVGGPQGCFVSSDAGSNWTTIKNLYVQRVNNLFYDEASARMTVTLGGANSMIFTVQLPDKTVSYADSGWNLRFARPFGDHLIAVTFFDGLVAQPRMVPSPLPAKTPAEAANHPSTSPQQP